MEKESPKSNILKSPMFKSSSPKSPMPKSPIPKSPVAYEKYKSRCGYGLISFFNFRRCHSKKMISDTQSTSLNRNALGDGYIENGDEFHSYKDSHDKVNDKSMMLDSDGAQVEKIKGRDASIEQHKKKVMTAKVENVKSDSEPVDDQSRNRGKAMKTSWRPHRFPKYSCHDISTVECSKPSHQNLADSERSSKPLESALTAEVLLHHKNENHCNCRSTDCMQHERVNEINLQVNMNEATEAYINQKLIDGKHLGGDGINHQSKHFLEALEILNSNRDLFIKLLQDPNSLLVKHIEDLRESQAKKLENKSFIEAESSEQQIRNKRGCNLSKETGDCQPFQPGSESLQDCEDQRIGDDILQIHYGTRNLQQSAKSAFVALEQMKRKLMRSMGRVRKEQHLRLTNDPLHQKSIHVLEGFGQHGKATGLDSIDRDSPDKACSDFGGRTKSFSDIKRKDQLEKANEFDPVVKDESSASSSGQENLHLSTVKYPKRNKHDPFVEPRANVSESKIGCENFLRRQRTKTWDGVSSVPENDLFPMVRSRRTREHGFLSPRKRFPLYNNHQMVSLSENNWSDPNENKNCCSSPLRQNVETKCRDSEEITLPEVPSKPDSSHNNGIRPSTTTADTWEASGSMEFSREVSPMVNQSSTYSIDDYSSSPLNSRIFREFDTIRDKEEHPSPVSVLDQFLIEEISSPLNNEFQPAKRTRAVLRSKLLLQIGIEEGCLADNHQSPPDSKINSSTSIKEYGSILEYISTVLQAHHFSWDELALKCHFSDQLQDQSLVDEMDVCSNHFYDDHRLLSDYVNEVLADVNHCYLRRSPWLSFIKPIQQAMMTGNVARQVMKHVDWNLLLASTPQTLDQILANDLSKCRTWMDIRAEVEGVVSEMTESLVEELMMEYALE